MARMLLFGAAREAAGTREATIDGDTVGEALDSATSLWGEGFGRVVQHCSVVVNGEVLAPSTRPHDAPIGADAEVAVLPPVSGGSGAIGTHEMVDVAGKGETRREATAACQLVGRADVIAKILAGALRKGDALSAARIAGTLAAKQVPVLIPMCHPVRTTYVGITTEPAGDDAIAITATVRGVDRTGFEVEALTAAAIAALTIYDMAKGEDPHLRVEGLRVIAKSGGDSGDWSERSDEGQS